MEKLESFELKLKSNVHGFPEYVSVMKVEDGVILRTTRMEGFYHGVSVSFRPEEWAEFKRRLDSL